MDTTRLLEYSHTLRNKYLEQLSQLSWEEVVKSRGASFDSLRNIFMHMIDNEDMMINYVIPGRVKEWVRRSPEEFNNMDSIRKRVREVESKTTAYIAKIKPSELERKVEVARPGRPPTAVRVEDILAHVVIENLHHFGELIALFWQIDMEPPHLGWITYIQKAK